MRNLIPGCSSPEQGHLILKDLWNCATSFPDLQDREFGLVHIDLHVPIVAGNRRDVTNRPTDQIQAMMNDKIASPAASLLLVPNLRSYPRPFRETVVDGSSRDAKQVLHTGVRARNERGPEIIEEVIPEERSSTSIRDIHRLRALESWSVHIRLRYSCLPVHQ